MCYTASSRFHAPWNISLPMSIRRVGTMSFLLYLLRVIGIGVLRHYYYSRVLRPLSPGVGLNHNTDMYWRSQTRKLGPFCRISDQAREWPGAGS